MTTFANRLRGRISEDELDNVTSTMGLAAMLCLFVVNPTGFVPELLIGAMLLVTLAGLALDLVLYGFGGDDGPEKTRLKRSVTRRFGEVAANLATSAALTAICVLTAESTDLDVTLLWLCVGAGVIWVAFDIVAELTRSTGFSR